jgi:hypothetical protein
MLFFDTVVVFSNLTYPAARGEHIFGVLASAVAVAVGTVFDNAVAPVVFIVVLVWMVSFSVVCACAVEEARIATSIVVWVDLWGVSEISVAVPACCVVAGGNGVIVDTIPPAIDVSGSTSQASHDVGHTNFVLSAQSVSFPIVATRNGQYPGSAFPLQVFTMGPVVACAMRVVVATAIVDWSAFSLQLSHA